MPVLRRTGPEGSGAEEMTHDPKSLEALLDFDALTAAEGLTGQSYKEDPGTEALGLALHLEATRLKREALIARDDTHYSSPFVDTVRIYRSEGFEVVLEDAFSGRHGTDQYMLLWNAGMLAAIESFGAVTNTNRVHLNGRYGEYMHVPSGMSGHFAEDVWVGYWDLRDGTRHKLSQLRSAGEVLPRWVQRPWLWLLSYQDSTQDRAAITNERISRLPKDIRDAISP